MIVDMYDIALGALVQINLDDEQFQPLAKLPDDLEKYFLVSDTALLVGIPTLLPTRARPKGVKNANALMRDALNGKVPRRKPIEISRDVISGRRLVLDGNSTLLNALHSGWPKVYATER